MEIPDAFDEQVIEMHREGSFLGLGIEPRQALPEKVRPGPQHLPAVHPGAKLPIHCFHPQPHPLVGDVSAGSFGQQRFLSVFYQDPLLAPGVRRGGPAEQQMVLRVLDEKADPDSSLPFGFH